MSSGAIPRVLHRVWVGGQSMPEAYRRWGEQWRQMHPHWEHRLWTDDTLPRGLTAEALAALSTPAGKADVIRIYALFEVGGVYVDCDVEPLRCLDPLLAQISSLGVTGFAGTEDGTLIGTAVLGSTAGHPLWADCIRLLPGWLLAQKGRTVDVQSGPRFVSAVIWDRLERGEERIEVLPSTAFYPYSYRELERASEQFPEAWAVHHWGSMRDRERSWRSEEQFAEDERG